MSALLAQSVERGWSTDRDLLGSIGQFRIIKIHTYLPRLRAEGNKTKGANYSSMNLKAISFVFIISLSFGAKIKTLGSLQPCENVSIFSEISDKQKMLHLLLRL